MVTCSLAANHLFLFFGGNDKQWRINKIRNEGVFWKESVRHVLFQMERRRRQNGQRGA